MKRKRVLVGLSGGVDSAVAAYLLKEEGYDVIGVTMKIWSSDPSLIEDASKVARHLNIPHHVIDFTEEFKQDVVDYFVGEYKRGRTPNPCVRCNRHIKFHKFLDKAFEMNAYYIATGHYASKIYDENLDRYSLKRSASYDKDQTYALYSLSQKQLKHSLFPLGDFTKEEVREMAERAGFLIASKPDSQEICFVEDDYGAFIEDYSQEKSKAGYFIDKEGKVLGEHRGIIHYTIGQRKGLGIALGKPMFVVHIDAENNTVMLGDNSEVFSESLLVEDLNLVMGDSWDNLSEVLVKIRYSAEPARAIINLQEDGDLKVDFFEAQRAITPGQAAVFYDGDLLLGGGTIKTRL